MNPNLPVGGSELKAVESGRWDLRMGTSMLWASTGHVAECPDLGPACFGATPPAPFRHHVDLYLNDTTLDVSYGATPWLAVEARAGVRVVDLTPSYTELDGTPKRVDDDIHHRNETLVGLTDPWLVLRTGAAARRWVTAARVGATLPIGSTEEDPYALAARGLSHQHTQFGSGTVVPIVGGGMSWLGQPVELSLSGLGFFNLGENAKGFRAPVRWLVGLRATLPLLDGKLRPFAVVDFSREGKELWHGREGMEGSFVRSDLLAGGGASWEFVPAWTAELAFRARVARFGEGRTFDYPGIFQFAVSTHFGGTP